MQNKGVTLKESEVWRKVDSNKSIVTLITQGLPSSFLSRPVASLSSLRVSLRNSTGEERRRQTLCVYVTSVKIILFEKLFRRISPTFKQVFFSKDHAENINLSEDHDKTRK